MYRLAILSVCALLCVGCALSPRSAPVIAAMSMPAIEPEEPEQESPGNGFEGLSDLLVFRQQVCSQTHNEREKKLRTYSDNPEPQAAMARLMLASCAPDQTPGLLANALVMARQQTDVPSGFFALVELMEAQMRSYSMLEQRLREVERQREDMIDGIRAIEAEMGTTNGLDESSLEKSNHD